MSFTLLGGGVLPTAGGSIPFSAGEKITYTIKKMGVKAGTATLTFQDAQEIGGKKAQLIVFTARAMNFFDEERIFIDAQTFLPLKVERNLDLWGKKEKIVEHYDALKGSVRIVKTVRGKTEEQVITKNSSLDNLYGVIYRYRRDGLFSIGDSVRMNLPTQDVMLELAKKKKIKAAGKTHNAYFMQSVPKKYRVWFDSSSQRIPLRIDGALGFGSTSMIMRDYQPARPEHR